MRHGTLFRSTATLAIATLVAGCATTEYMSISEASVEQDVDVQLTSKKGSCGVLKDGIRPDSVPAKKSRRDTVKWHIHNGCGVTLNEVKVVFENNDTHPFEVSCRKFIKDLDSASTGTIRCKLDGNANVGHYKYWIHINGDPAIEPDVEVWP